MRGASGENSGKFETGQVFIGTSGWIYPHWWEGVFYPPGLPQQKWLNYYARFFNTVEINNSFYRLPSRSVFEKWASESPEGFGFTVKASRFITHMKKLKDPETTTARFLRHVSGLSEKLQILLFQLPPFWKYDQQRVEDFLAWMNAQQILPRPRIAMEIRNPSWRTESFFGLLARYNVCLAFADWPDLDVEEPITADFIYVRRHGPGWLYASSYSDAQLYRLAGRISGWQAEGKDVFVYFNNDAGGFAIQNARRLMELLGIPSG
jgi:uncharacterized protein YecE (DUF72 family)